MKLSECLKLHTDARFLTDPVSKEACGEFYKSIPGRILDLEIDETKTNKQGVKREEELYKFGISLEDGMAFLEYFENRAQGQPTIALYANQLKHTLIIRGTKVEKIFTLRFSLENGKVKKITDYKD